MGELQPGDVVAEYRIESIAGRGGMGIVYRATQLNLDRIVALKQVVPELAEDETFRERFKTESRIAASLEHPHVIPVYEAEEFDDGILIAMRYIEGTDLHGLLAQEGRLEPERAARIVAQIASALDAAHARELVHRDIKPANVLITSQHGEDHAYLTDFGLSKRLSGGKGLTRTGMMVGTLDYLPPEQIEGKRVDARADVYALGCVLYEVLVGEVPFTRDSDVSTMFAHLNDPPPSPCSARPELPPELCDAVVRAMAKDPRERFQSAGDFGRAALAAARGGKPDSSERTVARGAAAPLSPPPENVEHTVAASVPPPPPPVQGSFPQPGGAPPAYGQGWAGGQPGWPAPARAPTNPLAIASLALAIAWVFWLGSIAAVVLGIVAKRQIDASGGAQGGRGLAIGGIAVGAAALFLFVVGVGTGFIQIAL